ncbi:hypothetical protein LTX13_002037 [Clostridium perfringens]|uniref:hypothetical protein n=1 Tax=Clostridium perfringens TaxID=1502 RepID=UPI00244D7424|nr:hypothetical protein [Clostridium perfringens]MDH2462029.1 hypothetical protein [Clostridium perfringens]MDM0659453.1 hypothetical protein [Clostridium perfringens]
MIGIIFIGDIRFCPYLKRYTNILDENFIKYKIIFWDRNPSEKKTFDFSSNNIKIFNKNSKLKKNPLKKLKDFFHFRRFVIHELKRESYSKLILLSTMSGVIIFDYILKKYKYKYIFDYRDTSYENYLMFKLLLNKLIKYSSFTCISSKGFKEVLSNKFNYIDSNNLNYNELELVRKKSIKEKFVKDTEEKDNFVINLSYFGFIRDFNGIKKFINVFKNDSRFFLYYHGDGPDYLRLKNYCIEKSIKNVEFTGYYDINKKIELMKNTDVINDYYEFNKNIKYCTANKVYDSMVYKKIILVNKKAYDFKVISKYKLGLGIDIDSELNLDLLYQDIKNKILNINIDDFNNSLNEVIEEDRKYNKEIKKFLLEKE